jgi:PAS domain S-box-containing protein
MLPEDICADRGSTGDTPTRFARVRRRLIVRRLPLFALAWLATIATWGGVLVIEERSALPAATLTLVLQIATLATAVAICRRDPAASRVQPVVMLMCLALAFSSTALFAAVHNRAELLAFALLTLYLASALAFAWGLGAELILLATTLAASVLAFPLLRFSVPPLAFAAAIGTGSLLSLVIAEASARAVRVLFLQRATEKAYQRDLTIALDAYRDLADNATDFVYTLDLEGRFTYVNDAAARLAGIPAPLMLGVSFADEFLVDDPRNPDVPALLARVAAGEVVPPVCMLVRAGSGPRWIEASISAVLTRNGRVVGVRGMSRDVTDRQCAEDALRVSEERFRTVFDSAPNGLVVVRNDGRPLQVNRAFCEMLGYTEGEILALPFESVTHPDDLGAQVDNIARLFAGEMHAFAIEKRYFHKDGHVVWGLLAMSLAPCPEGGVPAYLIAHVQDITERKQAEEALTRSEARYRGIVDSAAAFIARIDPTEGRFTFVNEAYRRLLGRPADELVGRSFLDIVHEDDRADMLAVLRRTLESPHSRIQFDCRVLTPGGSAWVAWEGSAILDGRGVITDLQTVGHDVTSRRTAENALRDSEARYRGIVDSPAAFLCRLDPQGRFTFVNETYCRKLGKPWDALIDQSWTTVTHEDDVAETRRAIRQVLEVPPHRASVECRIASTDGWLWVAWEGCAIADEQGTPVEVQAVGIDVTNRRAADEALRASFHELYRSEEKLRLLAQHQTTIREEERQRLGFDLHDDVCQELVGITIMVELLRRRLQPLPPGETADLYRIVRHLNEVVEHLRLLARDLRPMLLSELGLEGALRALAEGMSSGATHVAAEFQGPIPRLKRESETAVYRIAQEALTNATRHAAARAIVLTLGVADHALYLEVRDDGQGFAEQDRRRSRALGLVSMETRAAALGARLDVWSEPGKGTAVRLQCPLDAHAPSGTA